MLLSLLCLLLSLLLLLLSLFLLCLSLDFLSLSVELGGSLLQSLGLFQDLGVFLSLLGGFLCLYLRLLGGFYSLLRCFELLLGLLKLLLWCEYILCLCHEWQKHQYGDKYFFHTDNFINDNAAKIMFFFLVLTKLSCFLNNINAYKTLI